MKVVQKMASFVSLLLFIMMFLTGCGGSEKSLDEANPIPDYDGSVTLQETVNRKYGLKIGIPEDMVLSENLNGLTVTGKGLEADYRFVSLSEMEDLIQGMESRKADKTYKDTDVKETTLLGHKATAMIYNLKEGQMGYVSAVKVAVDLEEDQKEDAQGLIISVTGEEGQNAYELLEDQKVLAFFHTPELVKRGALDPLEIVPAYDGSLELMQELALMQHLKAEYPTNWSFAASEEETVISDGDGLQILFRLADTSMMEEEIAVFKEKTKKDAYYHAEEVETTYQGYDAIALIYSVDEKVLDQKTDGQTFELVLDFGETYVGGYDGAIIRVQSEKSGYAYDLLENQEVLACLNHMSILEGGKLDEEMPLPAYDGSLTLTSESFRDINLMLQIPEGMTVEETKDRVNVTAEDGLCVSFCPSPYADGLEKEKKQYETRKKEDALYEPDRASTEMCGLDTVIQIFHRKDSQEGKLEVLTDYGSDAEGPFYGLGIFVTNKAKPVYAYEWLKDQRVLALLENITLLEEEPLPIYEYHGISVPVLPGYQMSETSEQRGIAIYDTRSDSDSIYISIEPSGFHRLDFQKQMKQKLQTVTYGDQECFWEYLPSGNGVIHVYCPGDHFVLLDVTISMGKEETKETLEEILKDQNFVALMKNIKVTSELQ